MQKLKPLMDLDDAPSFQNQPARGGTLRVTVGALTGWLPTPAGRLVADYLHHRNLVLGPIPLQIG